MFQFSINEIATPFVTGFVGYFTNFLAIKMLFRPHKRRFYSFGWQGVIPRNRNKLATEVGTLVGENLISEKEISVAINTDNFNLLLKNAVEKELKNFLSKEFGSLKSIFSDIGLDTKIIISKSIDRILENEPEKIEIIFENLLKIVSQQKIKDFVDFDKLSENIAEFIKNGKIQDKITSELFSYINNIILSGASLKKILPENVSNFILLSSENITLKILKYLENVSEDDNLKEKIIQKVIDIKNNSFKSGMFDQLKLGILNMFLNEDTIREVVNKRFPEIMKHISQDDEIKHKITEFVTENIDKFINTPIYKFVEKFGMENFYHSKVKIELKMKNYFKSEGFISKILLFMQDYKDAFEKLTFGGFIDKFKAEKDSVNKIDFFEFINNETFKNKITDGIDNFIGDIQVSNVYSKIKEEEFEKISGFVFIHIKDIISRNVTGIVSALNIKDIVEKKINSLDLYEVEDMLFSFMKDQFKWINILGFVLGFLFGIIQIVSFKI